MAAIRADLDPIETQHAVQVLGRIGRTRAVAVIGHDDELEAGAARCAGNRRFVRKAVGPRGVDVKSAASRPGCTRGVCAGYPARRWRKGREDENDNGGRDGRDDQRP
jgi:hypothetical protein